MAAERAIRIQAGGVRLYAILADAPAARTIWEALPLEGPARLGPRGLFLALSLAPSRAEPAPIEARPGDCALGARPRGITLFFGPAPAAGAPAPEAMPVEIFGRITGDAQRLARVREGDQVRLTALEG